VGPKNDGVLVVLASWLRRGTYVQKEVEDRLQEGKGSLPYEGE